jgi:hypothetical protein
MRIGRTIPLASTASDHNEKGCPMKTPIFLPALLALLSLSGRPVLAQPCITSLSPTGELTWSPSTPIGFYCVESAPSASGPWTPYSTVADLDSTITTNLLSAQVMLTNTQAFFRVAWVYPNPVGVWDYRGYDRNGLAVTGQLSIPSMTLSSSNAHDITYAFQGSFHLQYAGSSTNWPYPFPVTGSGFFGGSLGVRYDSLSIFWPSNYVDNNVGLQGTILGNTCTGTWHWSGIGPLAGGPFSAVRTPSPL